MIWFDLRQRLSKLARLSVPAFTTLLLLLLTLSPWQSVPQPLGGVLTLASIFFWNLYRPSAMPSWLAALIGLVGDLIGVTPLGVGMLSALGTWGLAGWRRRELSRAAAVTVWGAFALTLAAITTLAWLLAAIANAGWYDGKAALSQAAIGVVAYPFLSYFLGRADRAVFKS